MSQLFFVPFLMSFLVSVSVTIITIKVYRSLDILDKSTKKDHPKHIHKKPVPRGGGVPIFISMALSTILFAGINSQIAGILAGAFVLMVLGVLDDMFDLSPYIRLLFGFFVAGLVIASGIGIDYVSNPFGEGVIQLDQLKYSFELMEQERSLVLWADLLAILWIVWSMNFVNMGAKGLDGQLPGVVMIASLVMGILGMRFLGDSSAELNVFMAFSLTGAYAGLLVFNMYPQKIMPGWGGGSLAGYFLAILSIAAGSKLATALIVLGIPLMDVIYAILRRSADGKSPVWGDDKHLHHRLLKLGWSIRKVAAFYWAVTAILGLVALQLNSGLKIYTIVLIAATTGGLLLWLNYLMSLNQRG